MFTIISSDSRRANSKDPSEGMKDEAEGWTISGQDLGRSLNS